MYTHTNISTHTTTHTHTHTQDACNQLKNLSTASPAVKLFAQWCERAPVDPLWRGRFKVIVVRVHGCREGEGKIDWRVPRIVFLHSMHDTHDSMVTLFLSPTLSHSISLSLPLFLPLCFFPFYPHSIPLSPSLSLSHTHTHSLSLPAPLPGHQFVHQSGGTRDAFHDH